MHPSFFEKIHGRLPLRAAVVIKLVLVVAALALLGQANAIFSLGIPVLLLHVGALAIIAVLVIWPRAHRSLTATTEKSVPGAAKTPHIGILLHSAALYDILAWFLTYGRERAFREKMLSFARLKPGEAVLDIGCGTGTVALLAKQQVGPAGRVDGVDASAEMVARATAKAHRAGLRISFTTATAQQLPYQNGEFDVVLSTLMLHHLPKTGRAEFGREALRVLKPGGRVLIVDFAKSARQNHIFRFHRHGHVDLGKVATDLSQNGFRIVEQGDVGAKGLRYLIAQSAGPLKA
ncbi:class I SAM-dependent methyltransferase [Sinorhizobium mexicanum]|nr:class I SAM-dependent methyltransferase [Sinorhizobium mexicanum]MBP1886512.1 ubiquinone/menaquinone biosynthesis C-methylase UbiE [Sinorhizobium mexicanum]